MLPTALLAIAGLLVLVIFWRLHLPSNSRLFAEVFCVGLVTIALVWAAWIGP